MGNFKNKAAGRPKAPADSRPGFSAAARLAAEAKASFGAGLWLTLLTAPLMGFKIDAYSQAITHHWFNLLYVFGGAFALSWLWRFLLKRRELSLARAAAGQKGGPGPETRLPLGRPLRFLAANAMASAFEKTGPQLPLALLLIFFAVFPAVVGPYHTLAMFSALLYVTLGLGLNLVVGLSGLLHLGYAAFFAIGAYTYGLLYHHLGWGFWVCLPLGAVNATIFGLLLGFPVLRLRGDYLAIVTLGFGEIVRLVLTNLDWLTEGSRGINNIPAPGLFNLNLNQLALKWLGPGAARLDLNLIYLYYLALALAVLTILAVYRLENSRLGRAWLALREDEIAGQAMGIDLTRAKLTAFALGSAPAGLAGALLAAQSAHIDPKMFDFTVAALILSIVVLGGMGSIAGVVLGALALVLLPEYLRAFSEYRPLVFGALMVAMMVFRPQGLIPKRRRTSYEPAFSPAAEGADHDQPR